MKNEAAGLALTPKVFAALIRAGLRVKLKREPNDDEIVQAIDDFVFEQMNKLIVPGAGIGAQELFDLMNFREAVFDTALKGKS